MDLQILGDSRKLVLRRSSDPAELLRLPDFFCDDLGIRRDLDRHLYGDRLLVGENCSVSVMISEGVRGEVGVEGTESFDAGTGEMVRMGGFNRMEGECGVRVDGNEREFSFAMGHFGL